MTFTFTSAAGDVADALLGAAAGSISAVAGAETVTSAYAARGEAVDTFVYLSASESTAISMDQILNFSVGAIDDVIDLSALGHTHAGVVNGGSSFGDFAAVQASALSNFQLDGLSVYVGSDGNDTWVFHSSDTHISPSIDQVIQLVGIDATGIDGTNFQF